MSSCYRPQCRIAIEIVINLPRCRKIRRAEKNGRILRISGHPCSSLTSGPGVVAFYFLSSRGSNCSMNIFSPDSRPERTCFPGSMLSVCWRRLSIFFHHNATFCRDCSALPQGPIGYPLYYSCYLLDGNSIILNTAKN